jgi:septal ring factor EnvC (AmiA/AmiB activator)
MKTYLTILTVIFLAAQFSCEPSLQQQIDEIHAEARKAGGEVAPKVEELTQQANSINVQGRALTPEEIEFTGQVASLQETFAQWNQDMEKAEGMEPGRERFDLEKKLLDAINEFRKQVESLAPKPAF